MKGLLKAFVFLAVVSALLKLLPWVALAVFTVVSSIVLYRLGCRRWRTPVQQGEHREH